MEDFNLRVSAHLFQILEWTPDMCDKYSSFIALSRIMTTGVGAVE